MWYLMNQFAIWLILALILGIVVGWVTSKSTGQPTSARPGPLFWALLAAAVIAVIVAITHVFRDRAGYWFDAALLMTGLYFIGCAIGCLLRRWTGDPVATPPMTRTAPVAAVGAATVAAAASPKAEPAKAAAPRVERPASESSSAPPKPAPASMPGKRPVGLVAPRGGAADDLSRLPAIDAGRVARLHGMGIYHYDQVCALTSDERDYVYAALDLKATLGQGAKTADYGGWGNACYLAGKRGPTYPVPSPAPAPAPAPAPLAPPAPAAAQPVAAAAMPTVPGQDGIAGERPPSLAAPRGGKADDLKMIRGIGKQNEGRLHGLGIWHFDQIGAWSAANALWVGSYLAFPGRIEREEWVSQAKVLAAGGKTAFAQRVERGEVATSKDDGSKGQGNVETLTPMRSQKGDKPTS